jgi:multidrug efflux pump subunit AcrA (membrane-fusion protein)
MRGRPPAFWLNGALALVLLATGGAAWYTIRGTNTSATTTTDRTSTVRSGTLTASVTASGNLESAQESDLSFSSSGTVTEVYVKVGQKVAKGAKLASIDPAAARRSLSSAKASLLSAQAAYDTTAAGESATDRKRNEISVNQAQASRSKAESALSTAKKTRTSDQKRLDSAVAAAQRALANGTGTAAQVSAAKAARSSTLAKDDAAIEDATSALSSARDNYDLAVLTAQEAADSPKSADLAKAKATLADGQATVDDAQESLDGTTLVAPHAGTVLSIAGKVGDQIGSSGSSSAAGSSTPDASSTGSSSGSSGSSSSSASTSSSFVTLADLTGLQVTAGVAEADAADLEAGQDASVTLSASGTAVSGHVSEVSVSGSTSNNVVTYPVTVSLDEVPDGVKLGASVSVSITTGSAQDALIVPSSAVSGSGNRRTVKVLENGVQRTVPVQVGIEGDTGIQITSGLSAGQTVVLSGSTTSGTGGGFPGGGAGAGLGGPPGGAP